jgi:membrane protein metalloendopeptidase
MASDSRNKRTAGQRLSAWRKKGSAAADTGYRICYGTGLYTVRQFRAIGKRIRRTAGPAARGLFRLADRLLFRHIRAAAEECREIGRGFGIAGRRLHQAWERHPLLVIPQALLLPALAVRRHRRLVRGTLNLLAPVAAAFVLVATVQYWTSRTFGLALEFDGQSIGYIADEGVYQSAAAMAEQRVIHTDSDFRLEQTPRLTLAVVPKDQMMDAAALCDEILRSSADSIAEASGLYVDGVFEGSVESRGELDAVLDGILSAASTGAENERTEFVQKVEVIDGLYPIASLVTAADMEARLTAPSVVEKRVTVAAGDTLGAIASRSGMPLEELRALNPSVQDTNTVLVGQELLVQREQAYLQVKVIRQVTYTEAIPFTTREVEDATKYLGYEAVRTKGKNGSQSVTAEEVYIGGVKESTTVLSTTVLEEPVQQVVAVGAKAYTPGATAGDGISTGRFIWPVPNFKNVYSPFGTRSGEFHKGIDISQSGIDGQPIVAADGGVVKEAGWGSAANGNNRYGYYIIIEHDGGYRTRYAHCKALNVKAGQKVAQGELIGWVGSTGYSLGSHLHFEILVDGTPVDPMKYLS